jgi:hypothetical protein
MPNYEMEPWNHMWKVYTPRQEPGNLSLIMKCHMESHVRNINTRLDPGNLCLIMKWNHGTTCEKYKHQARARPFKPNYKMEPWNHGTTCEKYKHPG